MFIFFPLLFHIFSVASSSVDKHPLPSKETREAAKSVIKDAILEYVRDPIRTINNRLTINTPFSSDTHKELSEILSKYRSGTSYRKGNAERVICDIGKHVNFSEPLSNVRSDLVSILKKCEPGEYGYLKNWGDVIDEVRKVYQEHVPPGVKEGLLNEDEDAYSFLVFLLMHFKLKFKEISDNTRSPNQGLKRKLASTNTRQKKRRTGIDSAVAEVSCEKLGNAPYIPGTQYIDTDASKFKLCNREPFSGLLPGISNIVVIESTLNDKSPKPIVGSDPSLVKLSEHHRHSTPIIVGQNISPRTNIPTVKAIPELTYSVHSNAATENQSQKTQVGGDPNLQHELEPLITAATNDDVKKVSPTVQSFESDWISLTPKLFCNEVIVPETLDPTQVAQGLEPFSTEPAADTECIFQVFDTFNTEAEEGIEKIALSLDFSNGVASDDFFSYLN